MQSKTSMAIFSDISQWIWKQFGMLPQPLGLLKLILNLFGTSNIQVRHGHGKGANNT